MAKKHKPKTTFKQYAKAMKTAQLAALRQTAFYFQNEVDPFVPIATGTLRKTGRVITDKVKREVFLAYGKGLDKYPGVQYNEDTKFDALHHFGIRGKYKSIGSTKRVYARKYRALRKAGRLVASRAIWFDAVLKDSKVLATGADIYAGTYKKEMRKFRRK